MGLIFFNDRRFGEAEAKGGEQAGGTQFTPNGTS
jgi:hypothetical protein